MPVETTEAIARVFLSHNSKDKPWVRALAEALAIELDTDSFLDELSLQLGKRWDEQIQAAIQRCPIALVMLGRNGWGPVHRMEAMLCLERARRDPEFRFIPVLLPGATLEDQLSFADGKVFDEIHRMDLSSLVSPAALADADSEAIIAGLRLILTGRPKTDTRELTPFLLRRDAVRWDKAKRPSRLLYRDVRLDEAAQLLTRMGELGIPLLREYVMAGVRARDRSRRAWIAGSLIAAGIFLGISLFAFDQMLTARARAQAAEALANPNRFVGLQAARRLIADTQIPEALAAPFTLLAGTGAAQRIFNGAQAPVTAMVVGDGVVFGGTATGEVWRWDKASGTKVAQFDKPIALLQKCGNSLLVATNIGQLHQITAGAVKVLWKGMAAPNADGYGEVSTVRSGTPGTNPITAGLAWQEGQAALLFDLAGLAWLVDCNDGSYRRSGTVPLQQIRHVVAGGNRILGSTEDGDLFVWRPGSDTLDARARTKVRASGLQWPTGDAAFALDGLGNLYRWDIRKPGPQVIATLPATPLRSALDAENRTLWMSGLNGVVTQCTWEEQRAADVVAGPPICKPLSADAVHHRIVSVLTRDEAGVLYSASADGSVVSWLMGQANPLIRIDQSVSREEEALSLGSVDELSSVVRKGDRLSLRKEGRTLWESVFKGEKEFEFKLSRDRSVALVAVGNREIVLLRTRDGSEQARFHVNTTMRMAPAIDDGFFLIPVNGGPVDIIAGDGTRSSWPALPGGALVSAIAGRTRHPLIVVGRLDGTLWMSSEEGWQSPVAAHTGPIFALELSDDHSSLISCAGAGDPGVKLWAASPLKLQQTLPAEHETTLAAARFAPGRTDLAATADDAGLVVLWDLRVGRARGRIRLPNDELINEIEFTKTGDKLAFRSLNAFGTIAVGPNVVGEVIDGMLVDVKQGG